MHEPSCTEGEETSPEICLELVHRNGGGGSRRLSWHQSPHYSCSFNRPAAHYSNHERQKTAGTNLYRFVGISLNWQQVKDYALIHSLHIFNVVLTMHILAQLFENSRSDSSRVYVSKQVQKLTD